MIHSHVLYPLFFASSNDENSGEMVILKVGDECCKLKVGMRVIADKYALTELKVEGEDLCMVDETGVLIILSEG